MIGEDGGSDWCGWGLGACGEDSFRFTTEVLFFQTLSLSHIRPSLFFTPNCLPQLALFFGLADLI